MILKQLTGGMVSLALVCGLFLVGSFPAANADQASIAEGKKLAFDRKKGNCLACHMVDDGALPGNIGPPLIAMKARFPDKNKLRAQIWNATAANPNTIMPPFGKHKILSEADIDKITDYIHSL